MTSTAPWRRMILHFSHMGLTEARTFTAPQSTRGSKRDGSEAQETAKRRENSQRRLAAAVRSQAARQGRDQAARAACSKCHGVRIRGPSAVIATVCSK